MSTRNEQFNDKMLSLDAFMAEFEDSSKIAALSDNGKGAETMYEKLDKTDNLETFEDPINLENQDYVKLLIFEGMLTLCKQEKLIPILEQIVKNGKNRKVSITQLSIKWRISRPSAERKYYRGVKALLKFISPSKIGGEMDFEKSICQ